MLYDDETLTSSTCIVCSVTSRSVLLVHRKRLPNYIRMHSVQKRIIVWAASKCLMFAGSEFIVIHSKIITKRMQFPCCRQMTFFECNQMPHIRKCKHAIQSCVILSARGEHFTISYFKFKPACILRIPYIQGWKFFKF